LIADAEKPIEMSWRCATKPCCLAASLHTTPAADVASIEWRLRYVIDYLSRHSAKVPPR